MATTVAARVQKRRAALRMAGLRPVQIWVPDTRLPNFAKECLRQSKLVSKADAQDLEMQLSQLRTEMAQMTAAAAVNVAQTLSLENTVDELISSTSWRVTSPLRFLSRLFKGSR